MLCDDLVKIALVHIGIPGALGINHDDRTFIAAIQASGGIDADLVQVVGDAQLLDLVLHIIARLLGAVVVAAGAAVLALVGAEENMLVVKAHGIHRIIKKMRNYTFRMRHR